MSDEEREIASLRICDHIVSTAWFHRCRRIACYFATGEEVATWSLIERALRRNRRVFLPVVTKKRSMRFAEFHAGTVVRNNRYGIAEPIGEQIAAPGTLDAVVTPLVAFDDSLHRIGMGGGYYDRTFGFLRHRVWLMKPKLVGVAFACQQVEKITANPWDIALLDVITENGSTLSTTRGEHQRRL